MGSKNKAQLHWALEEENQDFLIWNGQFFKKGEVKLSLNGALQLNVSRQTIRNKINCNQQRFHLHLSITQIPITLCDSKSGHCRKAPNSPPRIRALSFLTQQGGSGAAKAHLGWALFLEAPRLSSWYKKKKLKKSNFSIRSAEVMCNPTFISLLNNQHPNFHRNHNSSVAARELPPWKKDKSVQNKLVYFNQ